MDEQRPGVPETAGEISAPILPEKAAFSANICEIIAALITFIAAYIYVDNTGESACAIFTALFIISVELVNVGKERPRESWVWLGCMAVILGGILFRRCDVWQYEHMWLFLHLFAVWWTLCRTGVLIGGESGHFAPLDALDGFILFPFKHFFLRIRTLWYAVTHILRGERRTGPETALFTVLAVIVSAVLLVSSVKLLMSADSDFFDLVDRFGLRLEDIFHFNHPLTLMLSLPVGAYLFGLIAGSAREDPERLHAVGYRTLGVLDKMRRVPTGVWVGLTLTFVLIYAVFFAVQARYLFGAFTRTLPEGFIVSEYARQGFFELCRVMALNFALLWCVTRSSAVPVRENKPLAAVCALLLAESMLFAVVAFSKLMLYISCFGFTPLRLQSTWLVCVLFAGCVSAMYTLFTGKKSLKAWMYLGAVTLCALCLV